jgi:hypothetical protein
MAGKTRTISCLAKTRSRHLLQTMHKPAGAVVVVEAHPPEEARTNADEVNKVAVEGDLAVEARPLLEAEVISQGRAVVAVVRLPPRIETSGSTSYSISEARISCLLAYSSSPRSAARKTLKRCLTSTIAMLRRRVRYI